MLLKINGNEIVEYPSSFTVTTLDVDNAESTARTADGSLVRDRVAVKRQIEMSWGPIEWVKISALLQAMSAVFFELYYPDPMLGMYTTKTFYVGNRPAPFTIEKAGKIYWNGLKVTLTEK
jgi:hypothetical protein